MHEQPSQHRETPEEFFSHTVLPETQIPLTGDEKAKEEAEALFSGDLTDFGIWLQYENFRLKKKNEDAERTLRIQNAQMAFRFSAVWAIFIAWLICMHAMSIYFVLSQTEFITIVGALTASILTYYLLVIKYLFYRPKET